MITKYEWRYQRSQYAVARKMDESVKGPEWITLCNLHGSIAGSEKGTEADVIGRLPYRAEWCKQCAAESES